MKELNDLLDKTFGGKQETKRSTPKTSIKPPPRIKTKTSYIPNQADKNDLIEALGYAINAIKKKPDVINEVEDSAYLNHFTRWNIIREKLKK